MDYEETIKYLNKSCEIAYKHTLEVFGKVVYNLHDPQKKLKIIHVAGTNGKGSTCAMLRNILTSAGYKTGMFISPHLDKINERISIDGVDISDEDFAENVALVKEATEKTYFDFNDIKPNKIYENSVSDNIAENYKSLAYFEILTAAAFNYFYENKVDYAIIETGIGGRLDVTNIIENPLLSVITTISFDHMEYLGATLEAIASEKAGIIKNNRPLVLYSQTEKVYSIISNVCKEHHSRLYYDENPIVEVISGNLEKKMFNAKSKYYVYENLETRLLGSYQFYNICNVLLAVKALNDNGLNINYTAVKKGLINTVWPGRMEIIKRNPLFLIDGAHNTEAVRALKDSVCEYFSDKKITVIVGILKDKVFSEMLDIILKFAEIVIITKPEYSERAIDPRDLYSYIKNRNNIFIENDYKKAVDLSIKLTKNHDVICGTGSLYLIGDIRKYVSEALQ